MHIKLAKTTSIPCILHNLKQAEKFKLHDLKKNFHISLHDLVWFGLFVHPFSHMCNTGYVNYRLQFTKQLIMYGHPHNTI
jgi:hypothetical protein